MTVPLRVLLCCRDSPRSREGRMIGEWSYAVPEFVWDIRAMPRWFDCDLDAIQGYDLLVHEDTKAWGVWRGDHKRLPVVYMVRDSTLSDDHYRQRLRQAKEQSDLVLVDWDRLERFEGLGVPVRRCSHSVNERLFRDYGEGKTVDVAFHAACKGSPERAELQAWLYEFCQARGYRYACGVMVGHDYPRALSRAKIVVNLERNATTRAHRVFDALACGTCLLTSPEPEVSGEVREAGVHYLEWQGYEDLGAKIDRLLSTGAWQAYARQGYRLVQGYHTWGRRAQEMRAIINEALPWVGR